MRPGEIGDQWIVRVDDEQERVLRKIGDHRTPALGYEHQVPVPVELIAEEIAEADHARPDGGGQIGQRCLVHLEQAQLGIADGDEGGGDPRCKVRTGGVVGQPEAGGEDRRGHGRARRLPVRRRQDHASLGQTCGETRDRARIDGGEQLARGRRSAASPRQTGQLTGSARKARFHGRPPSNRV